MGDSAREKGQPRVFKKKNLQLRDTRSTMHACNLVKNTKDDINYNLKEPTIFNPNQALI